MLIISKFVEFLSGVLKDPKYEGKQIFHHCTLDPKQKVNTCFLLSAYEVIVMGKTPEDVLAKYKGLSFVSYGSQISMSYTVLEALKSLTRAYKLALFSLSRQRTDEYEHYRQSKEGAITLLIPNKLLVFEWLKG